jgi:hypothetical protein
MNISDFLVVFLSQDSDTARTCYRVVVIVAGNLRVRGNRNDGGHLETCGLGQAEVENVVVFCPYGRANIPITENHSDPCCITEL